MRSAKRQLSVALVLGIWLSSAVLLADACTMGKCRDDCDMHKLVQAHEMRAGDCGRPYHVPVLAAQCTCGAIHAYPNTTPAASLSAVRGERAEGLSLHLALLPAVQPQTPLFTRFVPREPAHRPVCITATSPLGLRAPPVA